MFVNTTADQTRGGFELGQGPACLRRSFYGSYTVVSHGQPYI